MNITEGVAEFLRWRKGGDGERRCWEVRGQRNKKACGIVKGGGIVKSKTEWLKATERYKGNMHDKGPRNI
jgi:hypothetical protein